MSTTQIYAHLSGSTYAKSFPCCLLQIWSQILKHLNILGRWVGVEWMVVGDTGFEPVTSTV
jgi:hypothetical protein